MFLVCSDQGWNLGDRLGGGGFGQVYAATAEDGTAGAVKLVPKEPGADRELLFAHIEGRNVVPVLGVGQTQECWAIAMPRAQGSLQDRIDREGSLTPEQALPALVDIASALEDLEGRVVHRDLKPANVLFYAGHWCLADFGIARYAEASTSPDTQKHALSPPYAAPERWRSERPTSATDVYSLGVIAYVLLVGELPFQGPGLEDFRNQHLHEGPPLMTGIAGPLAGLLRESLLKAPEARPSAQRFRERWEQAVRPSRSQGASRLAQAYLSEANRLAEQDQLASIEQSNEERLSSLWEAATVLYSALSSELAEVVNEQIPSRNVLPDSAGAWMVSLGAATLTLDAPSRAGSIGSDVPRGFSVIASSAIRLDVLPDPTGYRGRSHSLYYCDAQNEGEFGWYETAFMAVNRPDLSVLPYALEPWAAAEAFAPGLAVQAVAWPVTRVASGDLDDFVDRWLGWFAEAAEGRLRRPTMMPEVSPADSWRT